MKNKCFTLLFSEKYYKKNDIIENNIPNPPPITPWYLKILGFRYTYTCYVLGKPKQKGNNFEYDVKLKNMNLKWR